MLSYAAIMLHQVLPPPQPVVSEVAQAVNDVASLANQSQGQSESETQQDTSSQKNKTKSAGNGERLNNADIKISQQTSEALAKPTQPEKFPPEFTPETINQNNVSNSATALGEVLSVGYQLAPNQPNDVGNANIIFPTATTAEVAKTVTKSRNLAQPKAEVLVEKLAQSQKLTNRKNIASNVNFRSVNQKNLAIQNLQDGSLQSKNLEPSKENSATFPSTQQPLKVEFYSQEQQNFPSTIEFKSREVDPTTPTTPPNNQTPQPNQTQPPTTTPNQQQSPETRRVVEVISDRQEYDEQRRVVTAEGNVVVRFDGAVVDADRLQVNLDNLIAVGEGNVALTRGDQVLRGQKFTYNFIQDNGELERGSGEVFIPTAGTDLGFAQPGTPSATVGVQSRPLSDRIRQNQPLTGISSPGGIDINVGGRADASNIVTPKEGGQVRRVRFEAAHIDFYPRGWQARDVRLTNDPFSPPELEIRADKVTMTRLSPLEDRIRTQGQRLVFDQRTTIGIPKNEQIIDRRERDPSPFPSIGFDGDKRGGVFIERSFEPVNTETVRFSITPQFFVQKAFTGSDNFASLFGLKSRVNAVLSPKSRVEGVATFDSLDLNKIDDSLRASLRYQQALGDTNPHLLNLEYSYRDRLYNGTLGFQRVQSSLGGVLLSPVIPLGKSGVNLTYQLGAQYINANTDRLDLLEANRSNDRISLGRLQANVKLFGGVPLWQGKVLPATPNEGMRYTPNPIVPYLRAYGELNGTTSYYTNGDDQSTLFATVGLQGQIGNFSKPFLDYTGFNISYSQGLNTGLSPFLFDRSVDNKIINLGLVQQLYGPFRLGFQTALNIDTGESLSTEYSLEYSRRTYGITLRYNPVQQLGGISFRISDFNWSGGTDPFSDRSEVRRVVGGVEER
ncbi:hypothetical protein NIES4101_82120 [Calothrix sp. NIES-4101]|nr:hypothetical protein NIES4101_82120 [Calothrix sp. NIES-4101]